MTTPTAAPAAPVAAPPAPAPSPAPPAPAPAPASLLDSGTPPAPAAPAAPAPPAAPDWFYADGVKGEGPPPDFYNKDKYANLAEQAKAQRELEKRFGAFTGAPKDGVYKFEMPKEISGFELDMDSEQVKGFNAWAKEHQLSQAGYQELLGMYAQNLVALEPDMATIKANLGDNADARIGATAAWAKASFDEPTFELFKQATSGANADVVFKVIEAAMGKSRQHAPPPPNDGPGSGDAALTPQGVIDKMMAEKLPSGKLRFFEDSAFRADVEKRRVALFTAQG